MESRRDYKKLMNIKKRNKNYAKATILGALGLGFFGITTQVNAEGWKANSVEQIKESVKEARDGIYIIKTGDTLSGISEATGITIDTLANVNNIENIDLIYAGDKLIIKTGDGKVALVDFDNNVKNEVPLSKEDKQGIKEVQKQDNNNVYTNNGSSSTNNNGVINTVKPVKPTEGNASTNNGENTGGTTNPIKPVDPIKPINPIQKEFTITINHVSTDGEILSKETRKAKENTTVEAKAIDFSDRGYEVVGESTQKINVKEDTTITFKYKKIDDTKPVENTVNVEIKHLGDDGKVLSTEIIKAEKDSTIKADAKDFTDLGYVLNDDLTKSVKAVEGTIITFNYRKVDTPLPVEKATITAQYVAEDGTKLADNKVQEVEKGTLVKEEAIQIDGYKVIGDTTQSVVANSNQTITFTYAKDEKPTDPTNEDVFITKNLDMSGNDLGQTVDTTKYEEVSRKTEKSVETLSDGNTITTYTTTIIWKEKDVYVPIHTEETIVKNMTVDGAEINNTVGMTYVSETVDSGTTTTAENGDTHTIYIKTVVWDWPKGIPTSPSDVIEGEYEGVYYNGLGNSGMTFKNRMDADLWAFQNLPGNQGNNWWLWEVRMKGTNEIRITVNF